MGSVRVLNPFRITSTIDRITMTEILRIFILLESFLLLSSANGHREHKVHNITLYPDKHSWCNVLPIKQVISHPGCKSVEIDNNVCVGACFSYSIPHTEPSDPGEVIVPYCDSCQPSEKKLIHITLECEGNDPDTKGQQLKLVQFITNCSCTSCEKDKYLEQILRGNSAKEINQSQNDTPDLLDALQTRDETTNLHHHNAERSKNLKNLMNSHIMTLLKNIQSENSQKDKEQLTEALKIINGQSKEKVSDSSIAALVNSFYRENIELDLPKLLETLKTLEHSKYFEKHRKTYEGSGGNNNNDEETEGSHVGSGIEGSRLGMGHLKGSHIGMGLQHHHQQKKQHHETEFDDDGSSEDYDEKNDEVNTHNDVDSNKDLSDSLLVHSLHHPKMHPHHIHHHHHHKHHVHHDDSIGSSTDPSANEVDKSIENKDETIHVHPKHHHHHLLHHQHHHVGENLGHGHLAHGPHGSLVIEPEQIEHIDNHVVRESISSTENQIHEQINVNPHDLKPNHAGTLLSYSSHPTSNSN